MTLIQAYNSPRIAAIDDIYAVAVSAWNWTFVNKNGREYFCSNINNRCVFLHQFIAELADLQKPVCNKPIDVDHIDNNGLNCQISNLRYLPHSENVRRSKWTGNPNQNIYRDKRRSSGYLVRIRLNGHKKHIGTFKNIEEARAARDYFVGVNGLIVT